MNLQDNYKKQMFFFYTNCISLLLIQLNATSTILSIVEYIQFNGRLYTKLHLLKTSLSEVHMIHVGKRIESVWLWLHVNEVPFKDPICRMCLAGAVMASWSFTQEVADFTVITNIFVTVFAEFSETVKENFNAMFDASNGNGSLWFINSLPFSISDSVMHHTHGFPSLPYLPISRSSWVQWGGGRWRRPLSVKALIGLTMNWRLVRRITSELRLF